MSSLLKKNSPILHIENLDVSLQIASNKYPVIEGFNLSISAGQILGLVGESGSGKSVLCLAAMGLLDEKWFCAGSLKINRENILDLSEQALNKVRGNQAAMIFQDAGASLNPVVKIGNQLTEAVQRLRKISTKEAKSITLDLLKQVDIPDPERRYHEYSFQLSGGQNQRVMIASSLAGKPQLLFAEEPTTALDVTVQAQITALIKKVALENGMAVVFVSHDLGVVANLCTDIAVMYAGRIVEKGTTEQVLSNAQHPYTQGLINSMPSKKGGKPYYIKGSVPAITHRPIGCPFAARCQHKLEVCAKQIPELIDSGNTQFACFNPTPFKRLAEDTNQRLPKALASETAVMQLKQASCDYEIKVKGRFFTKPSIFRAIEDINLEIFAGRSLALIGESGSGKSTLSKLLLGLEPCSTGSVSFEKKPVPRIGSPGYKDYARKVQLIPQSPYQALDPRIKIGEQIAEPMLIHKMFDANERLNQVELLMQAVKLPVEFMSRFPHELSGGQLQRVVIARALALKPQVLICDEPTSALDVSVQGQIVELLNQLRDERNLAMLFITHDLRVIRSLCDDVAVLYQGKVVEHAPTEALFAYQHHPYTQSLLASAPDIDDKLAASQAKLRQEAIA